MSWVRTPSPAPCKAPPAGGALLSARPGCVMPARLKPLIRRGPTRRAKASAPPADPRRRLLRAMDLLEANLGQPQWDGPKDALEVLVLTILSQNTNDRNALAAYQNLVRKFPAGPARPDSLPSNADGQLDMRDRGGYRLEEQIGKLGMEQAMAEMTRIKGIGVKTAAVTLIEAMGADLCPVDTHVHRIINRLGIVQTKAARDRTFALLRELVPAGRAYALHHNLLTFGRTVCLARRPKCDECPLARLCPSRGKG
ncbi:hypothetical protein EDM80_14990 [bacterium]|nr:MAG: hypothetical protein EDM80_14990 [bacterium]